MSKTKKRPVLLRKHWEEHPPGTIVQVPGAQAVQLVVNHLGEPIQFGDDAWHIADGEALDGAEPTKRQRCVVLTVAHGANVPGEQCLYPEAEAIDLVAKGKAKPVGSGQFAWHLDESGAAVDGPAPPPKEPKPKPKRPRTTKKKSTKKTATKPPKGGK